MIDWARLLKLQKQQFQNSPPDTTPKVALKVTPEVTPIKGDYRIVPLGLDMWRVEEYRYIGGAYGWTSAWIENSDFYDEISAEKRIHELRTARRLKEAEKSQIAARAAVFPPRTVPPYKYINGE